VSAFSWAIAAAVFIGGCVACYGAWRFVQHEWRRLRSTIKQMKDARNAER
jgi:hypothetical protein